MRADPDLPRINGLEEMLDDLMSNLVSNAIKYTPSGGRVAVDLAGAEDGRVRLRVTDTGIGIPEEEKAGLFTEFFRGPGGQGTHRYRDRSGPGHRQGDRLPAGRGDQR